MSSWNWSPNRVTWQESLAFSLTFLLWLESPFFFSEFLRGIAVGVGAAATLFMLSKRHAWYTLSCAGLMATSWLMVPRPMSGVNVAFTHVVALMSLATPVITWWRERRSSTAPSPSNA